MAEQQQKAAQAAAAALAAASSVTSVEDKSLAIRPIEEVMEEDMPSSHHHSRSNSETMMEVDHVASEPVVRHFAARLGPSGLSPLVIGEVSNAKLTQEYLSKLLPNSAATTNFR